MVIGGEQVRTGQRELGSSRAVGALRTIPASCTYLFKESLVLSCWALCGCVGDGARAGACFTAGGKTGRI
jgi:hypothetical protein